jgi:diaminohydroxyphosphoribosylaminopyrimidine deaminase/5-amino-6-(5-phosphoribosylamino)uracil reductase
VRAEVDAIGVGSGTVLTDDPRLTARGAYREQPLTRVIFDRRLRTPPAARLLSTAEAGPVIIVTSVEGAGRSAARRALEDAGARIEIAPDPTFGAALRCLGARGIGSLLLEGGAALHAAAWDEGLVDFVRLYVTPHVLGPEGVPLLDGRPFRSEALVDLRVEALGADVLIEGYVHGPH